MSVPNNPLTVLDYPPCPECESSFWVAGDVGGGGYRCHGCGRRFDA